MKILKHGNLIPRLFTCKKCGCVFVADMKEYSIAASGDNFFVTCPECKIEFDMRAPIYTEKENDPNVIIDKTCTGYDDWAHSQYCEWMKGFGI